MFIINKVVLIGRLTKDPELIIKDSGNKYSEITLAVDRHFKNKDGQKEADFIQCVFWNSKAELLSKYVKKGHRIGIEGVIRTGSYETDEGNKRYTTKVSVVDIEFLEGQNKTEKTSSEQVQTTSEDTKDPFEDFGQTVALSDEDLPF